MKIRAHLFFVLALAALASPAFGIIVINSDESENRVAPANGAPWNYVARLDNHFGARASGVYLGNHYILTANHVDNDINNVFLNGINYAVDSSFTPVTFPNTDLRIIRILPDPGLPSLHLIGSTDSAFNQPATLIGWGVGKGTSIPNQGWNWGDDTTRAERWGTSVTLGDYQTDPVSGFTFLKTTFDITMGVQTGQLTGGDSGGGLFINFGGTWKLVGINSDVDTDNAALYDQSLALSGFQPDHSYFQSITQYADQINAFVVPEPGTGGLFAFGLATFLGLRRRRHFRAPIFPYFSGDVSPKAKRSCGDAGVGAFDDLCPGAFRNITVGHAPLPPSSSS